MKNCKNCKNAIFVELWGEYKCKVRNVTVYKPDDISDCTYHKPTDKVEESKEVRES